MSDDPATTSAARSAVAIKRELAKVSRRLDAAVDEDNSRYLYGAQQALEWALKNDAMAPSKAFEGISYDAT